MVAGSVTDEHSLSGTGSVAIILSASTNTLYSGIAVITPGNSFGYPIIRISGDETSHSGVTITFSGTSLTSNSKFSVNAMILE